MIETRIECSRTRTDDLGTRDLLEDVDRMTKEGFMPVSLANTGTGFLCVLLVKK